MKFLVTGSSGYLGHHICEFLISKGYQVHGLGRKECDLTNFSQLESFFSTSGKFDFVIHTAISGGGRNKKDELEIYQNNVQLIENLLTYSHKYYRFINIGSGAELFHTETHYGRSKLYVYNRIKPLPNFYHLRVFNVFNQFEIKSRFCRYAITQYIKGSPIRVLNNRLYDSFYMQDFLSLVHYYVVAENPPKEIDAVYRNKRDLRQMASYINKLDDYVVPIEIVGNTDKHYIGVFKDIAVSYVGLENAFTDMYWKLKKQ